MKQMDLFVNGLRPIGFWSAVIGKLYIYDIYKENNSYTILYTMDYVV
jgi:hypothetical protein